MKTINEKQNEENEQNCQCVKDEPTLLPKWLSKVIAVCGILSMMYVLFNHQTLRGGGQWSWGICTWEREASDDVKWWHYLVILVIIGLAIPLLL